MNAEKKQRRLVQNIQSPSEKSMSHNRQPRLKKLYLLRIGSFGSLTFARAYIATAFSAIRICPSVSVPIFPYP
jgi:hypothetical protein